MIENQLPDINKVAQELYKKNVELLEQRRRIEQLLHSVSEAVIAVDEEYKITLFNSTAEKMTGKSAGDSIGFKISDLVKLTYDDGKIFNLQEYCFNKSNNEFNGLILNGSKQFYINYNSAVVHKYDKRECLITLTDVTYEKSLDKTKDEFISVASHELRTPMTIIKSYIWMVLSGKTGDISEKERDYLTKAMNATERMLSLINDILNISRLEQNRVAFDRENFDIVDFLKDILSDFEIKTQEKGIYLNFNTDNKFIFVNADKDKLREVVTNLLGNSIKFTKQGGITVKLEETNEFILVQIIDTGAGINKEDLRRLFNKFGRLDNSYQTVAESGGTGLGLYIVKLYIEGMGGRVGAESDGIGAGSTFWFTVPTAK